MINKLLRCLLCVSILIVASTTSTNPDGTCPNKIIDTSGKTLTTCKTCVFDLGTAYGTCKFEEVKKKNNGEVCTYKSTCNIGKQNGVWLLKFCSTRISSCVNNQSHRSVSISTTTLILIGVGGIVVIACVVAAVDCIKRRRRNNDGDSASRGFLH